MYTHSIHILIPLSPGYLIFWSCLLYLTNWFLDTIVTFFQYFRIFSAILKLQNQNCWNSVKFRQISVKIRTKNDKFYEKVQQKFAKISKILHFLQNISWAASLMVSILFSTYVSDVLGQWTGPKVRASTPHADSFAKCVTCIDIRLNFMNFVNFAF